MRFQMKLKNKKGDWESAYPNAEASNTKFNNGKVNISADNVQGAIEELADRASGGNNSLLKDMRVSIIGDSTIAIGKNCIYWLEQLAGISGQNLAVSSTGFFAGHKESTNYINQISKIDNFTNIILVEFGYNDLRVAANEKVEVGTATDTGATTVAGYINDFFEALITAFPTVPIVCFCGGTASEFHPGIKKSDDWLKLIEKICFNKCIPFYDELYHATVLKPWVEANRNEFFNDYTHTNDKGNKVVAKFLYKVLADNTISDKWSV